MRPGPEERPLNETRYTWFPDKNPTHAGGTIQQAKPSAGRVGERGPALRTCGGTVADGGIELDHDMPVSLTDVSPS